MKIEFKPAARTDGRFAIAIFVDGELKPRAYILWIEKQDGRATKINNPEFAYSTITLGECQAICEYVAAAHAAGEISV